MKQPTQNKSRTLTAVTEDAPRQVFVRINPLRGIGGYGTAGDEVWMPADEAAYYAAEGYVTILEE